MTDHDYDDLFRRYAAAYQASLGETVEVETIRAFFAPDFLALATAGGVMPGKNDESFGRNLEQAYVFYRAIGTRRMEVDHVETVHVAESHDSVRVFYVAGYERRDGSAVEIPFDVVYLLQRGPDGPKIFAFIAGDEMGLYRQHGLVDAEGKPT